LYVYLLQSLAEPTAFYTGLTRQLAVRLDAHNRGAVPSTAGHRPWHIRVAVAFRDPILATRFERYLKSGSGRAFAKRHF
jgi:predicted GIY-YIG superfamily endonuclease